MVKTAKMELLRALITECLSAAAEEIFKIAERTIVEYEEEMSCSKWVVDNHCRLLDVANSHSKDCLQMSASAQQQSPASITVRWEEPVNTWSEPAEERHNADTHLRTSPDDEKHQCDQEILINIDEDDDIKQECDLDMHLKEQNLFKCPVCLRSFSSEKTMVRHIRKHPEDQSSSYQCQYCHRYFCHKSEFIIHTMIHKDSKPYKCQYCDKSFEHRDSLFIHRQKHSEEKPYQCFGETVEAETQLKSSTPVSKMEEKLELSRDESDAKTFPLTIAPYDRSEFEQESLQPLCLYQIQTVADIDRELSAALPVDHIKTEPTGAHDGVSGTNADNQLLLSVNPGEQTDVGTEPNHLRIKPPQPRRLTGKSTELLMQVEAGTAQKPFKCPCCTKCFSLTKTLIRHVKIHSEEKPYQCQYCGRNFCQKSDLVNHTRIHTGERPYRCHECNKSFAQKGNLVVHMRKHTVSVPKVQL
ncbi:oocyte zinc finger protein XlCOF28-like [Paralichthys olivaceus]|uniref:oocyte zinc finger protein XlCOF28-like n=1 Tax=Paralichthys olivaceus TaxID=8255 RepID=UPI003752CD6B